MADSPSRRARTALGNELYQLFLQQRIKKLANIVLSLGRGDLKLFADAIQHLRDGVFLLHEIPKDQANLIQGVKGIKVTDAVANRHDDEFAFDLTRDHLAIADKTDVIGKHGKVANLHEGVCSDWECPFQKCPVLGQGCHDLKHLV